MCAMTAAAIRLVPAGNYQQANMEDIDVIEQSISGSKDRVKINVSGAIFEVQLKTLQQFPESLLGNALRRKSFYDSTREEYFFDRHRPSFEAIFYFYQSGGRLRRPPNIPIDIFHEEIKYFDLGETVLKQYETDEDIKIENTPEIPQNSLKGNIWLLFEHPESSLLARFIAIFSVSVILFSIVTFCLETHPRFKTLIPLSGNETEIMTEDPLPRFSQPYFVIETACISWFTTELILRFLTCPQKINFLRNIMNVIDIVAVIPYFITLGTLLVDDENRSKKKPMSLAIVRIVRLIRVFRIFKLSRHSKGLQILGLTLRGSLRELGLLMLFFLLGVVLFSSSVYYAELSNSQSQFNSIPDAFWWAIVTMTTVGYGDMMPVSPGGRLIGSLCAISGVLCIALPVPVIVSNFNYYYNKERENERRNSFLNFNHGR